MLENKTARQDGRLKEEAKRALAAWKAAEEFLNHASDPALVDFAIYDLEAARRKYMYMLGQVRKDEAGKDVPLAVPEAPAKEAVGAGSQQA